jgi:hypothetical protein
VKRNQGETVTGLNLFVDNYARFAMQTFAVDKFKTATGTEI